MFPDFANLEHVARELWRPGPFGRATAMIGAGFSRNAAPGPGTISGAGMPLWSHLTDALVDELYPASVEGLEQRETARRRAQSVSGAMRLADEYEAQRGRTALDGLILSAIPDAAYEPGAAHRLLCALPWADILTTNYDTLIERALPSALERRYDVVRAPEELPAAIRPRIIKLHGSFPSSRPFVITEEDFRIYEQRAAAFVNVARQAFVETTVCLLGFSGDDPNFLRWSGWTRDVLGSARVNPIYLCGLLDLAPSQRALLHDRHVLPIDLSPLFPADRWPDRDLRKTASTEWLLLALEAGRPIDLSNWPDETKHPDTAPSQANLPERPRYSFVEGLAAEQIIPGFRLPEEPKMAKREWSPNLSPQEQIKRAQQSFAEHRARTTGEPLQRQIEIVTAAWANNRSSDPGWVLLPQQNRRSLWQMTQQWVRPIISTLNDVSPEVAIVRLDELTWRIDRCLLTMGDEIGEAVARALAAIAAEEDGGSDDPLRRLGASIRGRWLGLAGRLLSHYRDACADDAFDALAARLRRLSDLDPEIANRVTHEQALAHLERWQPSQAEKVVCDWVPSADPAWLGRRAGLLAELDRPDALQTAEGFLQRVRSGWVASRDPSRRTYWLSREAMALMLVRCIGHRHSFREFDVTARFIEIRQAGCDPRSDLDTLSDSLARPPSATGEKPEQRFLDDVGAPLKARQLKRAHECLGQPVDLTGIKTAAAAGLRHAIPWIAEDMPNTALRAFCRLYETFSSDQYADRWLALASKAVVDKLAGAICDHLERMADVFPTVAESSVRRSAVGQYAHRPGEIDHEHTYAALGLARVLLARLEEEQVFRLIDACLKLRKTWRGGKWQTWGELGRTARTALESLPKERRGEKLLAVIQQPIVGRDVEVVHGVADENEPIFAFLARGTDGAYRDTSWDGLIAELLGVAASEAAPLVRAQALRRLWALHTRGLLTDHERVRFRDAVWSPDDPQEKQAQSGSAAQGISTKFVSVLERYPLPVWTLLYLPSPEHAETCRLVRTLLSMLPLPTFMKKASDSGGWAPTPRPYDDPISQILMATARPWMPSDRRLSAFDWPPDNITRALGNIEAWWEGEGADFTEFVREEAASPVQPPKWRLESIAEFIAFVALPACIGRSDILQRCVQLDDRLGPSAMAGAIFVPLRLAAGTMLIPEGEAALQEASSAQDPEQSIAFLNAVLLWMSLAERGHLPPLPTDLVKEIASGIRSRRSPDLKWLLQIAAILMDRPGDPLSGVMLNDLRIGLQYLAHETKPDAGLARYAVQPFEIMALRAEAASLLETVAPLLTSSDATGRAWLDDIDAETFVHIRTKLLSARSRMTDSAAS